MAEVKKSVFYGGLIRAGQEDYIFGTGISNTPFVARHTAKKAVQKELKRCWYEGGFILEYGLVLKDKELIEQR